MVPKKQKTVPAIDFLSRMVYNKSEEIVEVLFMKKKNIINLIKYYAENNDSGFRSEAYEIARDFDTSGDYQLSEYIMALLSSANTFIPQSNEIESEFIS